MLFHQEVYRDCLRRMLPQNCEEENTERSKNEYTGIDGEEKTLKKINDHLENQNRMDSHNIDERSQFKYALGLFLE